jgi:sugar/nucleoside kinase (ribokinase family)
LSSVEGPQFWVVTRGSAGVSVYSNRERADCPPPKIAQQDIRDVSGAGDVLFGAVAGYLAQEPDCLSLEGLISAVNSASNIVAAKLLSMGALEFLDRLSND